LTFQVAIFIGARSYALSTARATLVIGRGQKAAKTAQIPGFQRARARRTNLEVSMKKLLILALIALAVPSALLAQDDDWRNRGGRDDGRDDSRYRRGGDSAFELAPFLGYRYGGTLYGDQTGFLEDLETESNPNFGVNFAIPVGDQGFKLELMANKQDTHLTAGGGLFSSNDRVADIGVTYYHAGLLVPFARSRSATPYFVVSAGITNLDPDIPGTSDDNRFSVSGGVGVKVPINRNFGLRAEARGYATSLPDDGVCRVCGYYDSDRAFYQGETNVGLYFRF
jgi:Outer membrane protein beta-barrel domain